MLRSTLPEYRAKRRVSLLAEVSCQSQFTFGFGKTENISETGVMIKSRETLPLGSDVEVRFVLPIFPQAVAVSAKAKVAWVEPQQAMGIQFLGLSEEYRLAIAKFVGKPCLSPTTSALRRTMVPCKSCGSTSRSTFGSEIAIHFRGLANIDKPIVWVFPELMVCLNCGFAEFVVPEAELRLLAEGGAAGAA